MSLDFITTIPTSYSMQLSDDMPAIEMHDVTSSNIGRIGYDADSRRLFVQFCDKATRSRDGNVYAYERVPNAVFEALMQAEEDDDRSIGSTFQRLVKNGGFRYVRL